MLERMYLRKERFVKKRRFQESSPKIDDGFYVFHGKNPVAWIGYRLGYRWEIKESKFKDLNYFIEGLKLMSKVAAYMNVEEIIINNVRSLINYYDKLVEMGFAYIDEYKIMLDSNMFAQVNVIEIEGDPDYLESLKVFETKALVSVDKNTKVRPADVIKWKYGDEVAETLVVYPLKKYSENEYLLKLSPIL